MSIFSLEITSTPDRENLVAEIWLNNTLFAEVNHEKNEMEVEIYIGENNLQLPFEDFLLVLQKAKEELLQK